MNNWKYFKWVVAMELTAEQKQEYKKAWQEREGIEL